MKVVWEGFIISVLFLLVLLLVLLSMLLLLLLVLLFEILYSWKCLALRFYDFYFVVVTSVPIGWCSCCCCRAVVAAVCYPVTLRNQRGAITVKSTGGILCKICATTTASPSNICCRLSGLVMSSSLHLLDTLGFFIFTFLLIYILGSKQKNVKENQPATWNTFVFTLRIYHTPRQYEHLGCLRNGRLVFKLMEY